MPCAEGVRALCLQNKQGRLFLPKDTLELACACASVELEALSVAFFGSRHEYEVGC